MTGRVLSAHNAYHLAEAFKSWAAFENSRVLAHDLLDEHDAAMDELHRHGEKLMRHLRAIKRNQEREQANAAAPRSRRLKPKQSRSRTVAMRARPERVAMPSIKRADAEPERMKKFPRVYDHWFDYVDVRRQVEAIFTTDGTDSRGEILRPKDCRFDIFMNYRGKGTRAVLCEHREPAVAYCVDLLIEESRIIGVAQFPPPSESAYADEIFDKICDGQIRGASKYSASSSEDVRQTAAGTELGPWELREWSFCEIPVNLACLVTKIGGVESGLRWVSSCGTPKTPRMPTMQDCGWDRATYAAAIRRFDHMQRTAPWN
jgi:hypothetical protein